MEQDRPKVGVGVMIWKDGKVLIGKRKNAHGAGEYAWPGGHLEYGETFEDCVAREAFEEAGINITNIRFLRLLNFRAYGKHYVDIGMIADWQSGEVKVKEPEKCQGWEWLSLSEVPENVFAPVKSYFTALETGQVVFDEIYE